MLAAQNAAKQDVESMNTQLEQKVTERTIELAEQNNQLAYANEQLHKLDEMKSEFVAMVSHELRTPLTVMNGAMEMTLRDDALTLHTRNTMAIMAGESKRLTDFVQTILDLSKLEAGKLQVNLGPVALRPLMEQAAGMILAQSNRPVVWDIAANLPPAWADEVLLEEALRNLIRNADKYSPRGKPITLSAKQESTRIYLGVRDEGRGVAAQAQERIFDRFARGESGESAPPGWGLGLYLARKLMEAQKGEIGVLSPVWLGAPNPGSEFFVRIPVADTPEEEEK
jgi:signal transduction histidine kinase